MKMEIELLGPSLGYLVYRHCNPDIKTSCSHHLEQVKTAAKLVGWRVKKGNRVVAEKCLGATNTDENGD